MAGGGGQLVLDLLPGLDHGGHDGGVGAVVTVYGLVRPVLCGGCAVLNKNISDWKLARVGHSYQRMCGQQLQRGNLEQDRMEEKTLRTGFIFMNKIGSSRLSYLGLKLGSLIRHFLMKSF